MRRQLSKTRNDGVQSLEDSFGGPDERVFVRIVAEVAVGVFHVLVESLKNGSGLIGGDVPERFCEGLHALGLRNGPTGNEPQSKGSSNFATSARGMGPFSSRYSPVTSFRTM